MSRVARLASLLGGTTLAIALLPSAASAAPADYDPGFAGGGRTTYGPAFRTTAVAQDVADDRFVTVAVRGGATSDRIDVRRFTPTGLADPSWNAGAPVQIGGGLTLLAPSVVVDSLRDYVYVSAWSDADQVSRVWRLLPTGALDPSWGTNGRADFANTRLSDLALTPGGALLIANANAVYRLTGAGVVDPAFGTGGGVTLPTGAVDSLAVTPTGLIYAAGRSAQTVDVVRLGPRGALDPAFGTNGRASYRPTPSLGWTLDSLHQASTAVQSDGRIVLAAGMVEAAAAQQRNALVLARLGKGGGPDKGFTPHRDVGLQVSGEIALQRNDKVLVPAVQAGHARLLRVQRQGAYDASFAAGGFTDGVAGGRITGAVVQRAGRVVAAGYVADQTAVLWGLLGDRTPRCQSRWATLYGGPGRDRLTGTSGDDVIVGDSGRDRISAGAGADRVCAGPGRDVVKGGGGRDTILGGAGADRLFGEGGPDKILGGGGPDRLFGGPGHDRLRGGGGRDVTVQ